MQLVDYYHRIQQELGTEETDDGKLRPGEYSVTLEELSELLHCTDRNVKLLLRKMTEQGWILWKPGRGRGNRSSITLLTRSEDLLMEEAKEAVRGGNVKAAIERISAPGIPHVRKDEFFQWLSGHFGYQEAGDRAKSRDTLRLPAYSPVICLDPAEILYAKDMHLAKHIFDTLVRFDPSDRSIKPHVAHYWEHSEEGRRWTFFLRKGIRFHHGRELTAEDAAFTLERLKQMEHTATNGWLAHPIREVTVVDRYVLQVDLHVSNHMYPHYASAGGMSILPKDLYGSGAASGMDLKRLPVGTGPFRVAQHDESVCILTVNEDYFRERAHLDRVELWMIPPESRRVMEQADGRLMRSGRRMELVQPDAAKQETREVSKIEQGCMLLTFNIHREGPQRHRSFREAVSLLTDRADMALGLGDGEALPAAGFLPERSEPGMQDKQEEYVYDPLRAKKLLAESGYAGEELILYVPEKHEHAARWLAERWKEAGIQVEITALDRGEASTTSRMLEADIFVACVVADDDLDFSLLEMYRVGNLPLRVYFSSELELKVNRRITAILQEELPAERPKRIRELEQLLKEDYQVLFLLHPTITTTFDVELQGVSLNSLGWVNFKDIWFRPTRG